MIDFEKLPSNDSDVLCYCLVDPSRNIIDIAFENETARQIQADYVDEDGFCSVRIVTLNLSTFVKFFI